MIKNEFTQAIISFAIIFIIFLCATALETLERYSY